MGHGNIECGSRNAEVANGMAHKCKENELIVVSYKKMLDS
jgi:hypothetical protein